jgi:hypothetical protein
MCNYLEVLFGHLDFISGKLGYNIVRATAIVNRSRRTNRKIEHTNSDSRLQLSTIKIRFTQLLFILVTNANNGYSRLPVPLRDGFYIDHNSIVPRCFVFREYPNMDMFHESIYHT